MFLGVSIGVLARRAAVMASAEEQMHSICLQCGGCGGGDGRIACMSLDCHVYYDRVKVATEMDNANRCLDLSISTLELKDIPYFDNESHRVRRSGFRSVCPDLEEYGHTTRNISKESTVVDRDALSLTQVDPSVMKALPRDIQNEIITNVRETRTIRKQQHHSARSRQSPSKVRMSASGKRKFNQPSIDSSLLASQLNLDVLHELPIELRKEIMREYGIR